MVWVLEVDVVQRFGNIRHRCGGLGVWTLTMFMFAGSTAALPARPLDLELPPGAAHYPATVASSSVQPGAYYGDHSDALGGDSALEQAAAPKTHIGGSISTGFYGGSRHVGSGMWNEADLDVGQPTGSGGMMNFSLGIGQAQRFGGNHRGY